MDYELHPLCTLFPRLSGQEFQNLVEDIAQNGLREPIILHEGMILDGGNRYRACIEAGIKPEFMKFGGGNLVAYVLSANLHRRHMTPGQQAAIVASAQDWSKAQSVGNPQLRNVAQLETAADRAAQSGASHRTQQMADKVAKADPELAKQVAHGEISLPKAIEKITPKKEKDQDDLANEALSDFDPIAELEAAQKEIERLTKVIESDDQLAAAMAENKRLHELVKVIEGRVHSLQSSENEAKKAAKSWKNKYDKLARESKAAGMVNF